MTPRFHPTPRPTRLRMRRPTRLRMRRPTRLWMRRPTRLWMRRPTRLRMRRLMRCSVTALTHLPLQIAPARSAVSAAARQAGFCLQAFRGCVCRTTIVQTAQTGAAPWGVSLSARMTSASATPIARRTSSVHAMVGAVAATRASWRGATPPPTAVVPTPVPLHWAAVVTTVRRWGTGVIRTRTRAPWTPIARRAEWGQVPAIVRTVGSSVTGRVVTPIALGELDVLWV